MKLRVSTVLGAVVGLVCIGSVAILVGVLALSVKNGATIDKDKEYDFPIATPVHDIAAELAKIHILKGIPPFRSGGNYKRGACALSENSLYLVRPSAFGGELVISKVGMGDSVSVPICQPSGATQEFAFNSYFDRPFISVNGTGDALIGWTLESTGRNALALNRGQPHALKGRTIDIPYPEFKGIGGGRDWYLFCSRSVAYGTLEFAVLSVDERLEVKSLGSYSRNNVTNVLDATIISPTIIRVFWAESLPAKSGATRLGWTRLYTADFDLESGRWHEPSECWRLDRWSFPNGGRVHALPDGSVHHLWMIDEQGGERSSASGLFYQQDGGEVSRLASAYVGFQSLVVGMRIVACYSIADRPDVLGVVVLQSGSPGRSVLIKILPWKHIPPDGDNLLVSNTVAGDTFFFADTRNVDRVYELRLVKDPREHP